MAVTVRITDNTFVNNKCTTRQCATVRCNNWVDQAGSLLCDYHLCTGVDLLKAAGHSRATPTTTAALLKKEAPDNAVRALATAFKGKHRAAFWAMAHPDGTPMPASADEVQRVLVTKLIDYPRRRLLAKKKVLARERAKHATENRNAIPSRRERLQRLVANASEELKRAQAALARFENEEVQKFEQTAVNAVELQELFDAFADEV
jgi:hypothetical protein